MFSSMKAKLITILLILGVAPLSIVGYQSYQIASNTLLEQTKRQLGNLADKTAQQVDIFFKEVDKDINLLSTYPFIQLSFLQYEFGQRLDTVKKKLMPYEKKNRYFNNISLINIDGRKILSVPDISHDDKPAKLLLDNVYKVLGEQVFLSDIFVDNGSPFLILAKVVYDFEDNTRPVGFLVFNIKSTSFTRFVSTLKVGEGGHGFILCGNSYIKSNPEDRLLPLKGLLDKGDGRLTDILATMARGKRGFGEFLYDGEERYIAFSPCNVKGWCVGITLYKTDLMAGVNQLKRKTVNYLLGIVALILLATFFFVRGITVPIRDLIKGARAVGGGDLNHTIEIKTNDELRRVATEFNRMAKRLKESLDSILELKTFNEDILRSVTSGIITIDQEGKLTSLNKNAEEILKCSWTKINHSAEPAGMPRDVTAILELLQKTLKRKKGIQHHEIEIVRQDNEEMVFVEVNTSLLKDGKGTITGALAEAKDISPRKKIEKQILRIDKMASLGALSAGIAHEIRNPLAGIKTSVEVLANRIDGRDKDGLIQGVSEEIERLDKFVTDLLQFSRPSPPVLAPADISLMLDRSLNLVMESIKESHIELVRKCSKYVPPAMVDKEQMQQIFLNLLLNAIKSMPDGGKLQIQVGPDRHPHDNASQEMVRVIITDTGKGIKKEDLSRIFNPFFTTDPQGTGLGLSVAHRLMEENRGVIDIESKYGVGTYVTLWFPTLEDGDENGR